MTTWVIMIGSPSSPVKAFVTILTEDNSAIMKMNMVAHLHLLDLLLNPDLGSTYDKKLNQSAAKGPNRHLAHSVKMNPSGNFFLMIGARYMKAKSGSALVMA